ncbi:hypothetical protein [Actinophytocola sp.]|uniref:hypothetical protein n=1 Tax=Actinophytocola sp. TaxID=1872138 RepID=UPI002D6FB92A|nr:hypothetical protein [Actinophytocola sp.]HYQ67769.1 hypothetical protein [Actinophytocola sp.]
MTEDDDAWRDRLTAARTPTTSEQSAWDAEWQRFFDRLVGRGVPPNAAIRRADDLMDLSNHGLRPEPKEVGR